MSLLGLPTVPLAPNTFCEDLTSDVAGGNPPSPPPLIRYVQYGQYRARHLALVGLFMGEWMHAYTRTSGHITHPHSQWRNPPSPPHAHTHTHAHAHTRPHAHGHGWGGGSLPAPPFNPFLSSLTQPTYSSRCVRHHDWSDGGLLLAKCIVSFLAKSNTHAALTWAWAGLKPFFLCFIDIFCK